MGLTSLDSVITAAFSTRNDFVHPTHLLISSQVQMRLLGNAARLFTTAVESADAVLLLGYGASFTLNGILAWQIRAYAPRKED